MYQDSDIKIIQIAPAPDGWQAVYAPKGSEGVETHPIAAFALIRLHHPETGDPRYNADRVVGMIAGAYGELRIANEMKGFAGMAGPGEWPALVAQAFEDMNKRQEEGEGEEES